MNANDNSQQTWLVVVDGGGSKVAVAALLDGADPASALTWHFDGTGSAHPSTWHQASHNLSAALEKVAAQIHQRAGSIGAVKLALAGAGRLDDQQRVLATLADRCSALSGANVVCCGDIDPLLDYRVDDTPCIAVILGTGSVVASRDAPGTMVRAGGWGPLLGDACSGGAIGLAALRYLSQLIDEGQGRQQFSGLAQAVADRLALSDGSENRQESIGPVAFNSTLIQVAADRARAAQLAGVVLQHAYELGDRTALELVDPQVADIVWQIRQVALRTGLAQQAFDLNFSGGLAEHCPQLRQAIVEACVAVGLSIKDERFVEPLAALLAGRQ
jgi:N-acetylglucosamine kinase-like BadF-type ATPase